MAGKITAHASGAAHRVYDEHKVGSWAARCNLLNQETLLSTFNLVSEIPIEVIADRLDIHVDEARAALEGRVDLTLTELRLLGVAGEVIVNYQVTSARRDYTRLMHTVTRWRQSVSPADEDYNAHDLDPAVFARRVKAIN